MDVTLLSGVVRNRKAMTASVSRANALFEDTSYSDEADASMSRWQSWGAYLKKNNLFRKFSLRVHKFSFQWDLVLHLAVCLFSLAPFFVTGKRKYSILPIGVWLFYNILFLVSPTHSNLVIPRFGKFRNSFNATIADFFSPKLLPVLSISFLSVVLTLVVTGHRLGGPPLCYQSCSICLSRWTQSVPLTTSMVEALQSSANMVQHSGTVATFHYPRHGGDAENAALLPPSAASGSASSISSSQQHRRIRTELNDAFVRDPMAKTAPIASEMSHIRTLMEELTEGAAGGDLVEGKDSQSANGDSSRSSSSSSNSIEDTFTIDQYRIGCGYANGKEMLGYYTMAQTSFLLFIVVVVAMTVCLAWKIADEEKQDRRDAEAWLKRDNLAAFELRQRLIDKFGSPASSSVRPEGNAVWVFFGIIAALTFTLLGWHNWYVLPPSPTATLLIVLNLLTITMSTMILHVSFFGRLLALYKRNFKRVQYLTILLQETEIVDLDSWWNCRSFVLNDDLSVDYDMGGLGVSATFLIGVSVFIIFLGQIYREGFQSMLEAPGSYCAYACLYVTNCLIKLFTLATNTFEEQHRHIAALQALSTSLTSHHRFSLGALGRSSSGGAPPVAAGGGALGGTGGAGEQESGRARAASFEASNWIVEDTDYQQLQDDGPIFLDDEEEARISNSISNSKDGVDAGAVTKKSSSQDVQYDPLAAYFVQAPVLKLPQELRLPSAAAATSVSSRQQLQPQPQPHSSGLRLEHPAGLSSRSPISSPKRSRAIKALKPPYSTSSSSPPPPAAAAALAAATAGTLERSPSKSNTAANKYSVARPASVNNDIEAQSPPAPALGQGDMGDIAARKLGASSSDGAGGVNTAAVSASVTAEEGGGNSAVVVDGAGASVETAVGTAAAGTKNPNEVQEESDRNFFLNAFFRTSFFGPDKEIHHNNSNNQQNTAVAAGTNDRGPLTEQHRARAEDDSSGSGRFSVSNENRLDTGDADANLRQSNSFLQRSLSHSRSPPVSPFSVRSMPLVSRSTDVRDHESISISEVANSSATHNKHVASSSSSGHNEKLAVATKLTACSSSTSTAAATAAVAVVATIADSMTTATSVNRTASDATSNAASNGQYLNIPRPPLTRGESSIAAATEGQRQSIADMISQIRKYDPYPCILGIPVMPALFTTCKFYIFICFMMIGVRTMISCLRQL